MRDPRLLGDQDTTLGRRMKDALKWRVAIPGRYAVDLAIAKWKAARTGRALLRVALVSDGLAYCSEQQYHPFRHYRRALRDQRAIVSNPLRLDDVLHSGAGILRGYDVVGVKLTYRTDPQQAEAFVEKIASLAPAAKLMYFDGDDDVCIQWPRLLPMVDLYAKKHVFSASSDYEKTYIGKSDVHDYVARTFGHRINPLDYGGEGDVPMVIATTGPVPSGDIPKIALGWNIGLDVPILNLFDEIGQEPLDHDRSFDITFRGSAKAGTITQHLRGGIEPLLAQLEGSRRLLIGTGRVPRDAYLAELKSSKICVSPFGFGEVCWRDFETVLSGALMIKPDMSHVRTSPDIYRPYETYVPVKWDMSDLVETCEYYLEHEDERRRIVEAAFAALTGYYREERFLDVAERLLRMPADDRSPADVAPDHPAPTGVMAISAARGGA